MATAAEFRPNGLGGSSVSENVNHPSHQNVFGDSHQVTHGINKDDYTSERADVALPTHPLQVRPLGNKYLSTIPDARKSAGAFRQFPDEVLLVFLEYLDGQSLYELGRTCKLLFAFCHSDDLWKSLFLESEYGSNRSVQWNGSWRSTLLRLSPERSAVVDCSNVFSDVLHRPFVCSHINLAQYVGSIPERNQISRFENLSYSEFAERWSEQPFMLSNCIQSWPALRDWTLEHFCEAYGSVGFRAEAVDWTFESYNEYMKNSADESPLYLFDKRFAEKMGITVGHTSDAKYWRPECFGPDLFEVLGDERPAHRWLIIGPRRSGSTFHKDPNATSAWNAVIQGAKYWIMFPPDVQVPGVYVSNDSSEVTSPLSIAEWLLEFHAEARQLPECLEGICKAGEILHVPSGWWHLVVNLDHGIALTQNFVPKSPSLHHLAEVLCFLRDKPDQVTGFKRDIQDPYRLFAERLEEHYPKLLDEALAVIDMRKGNKKRKWDAIIGVEEEGSGRGFSFGFGGVDTDEEIP